MGWMQYKIGRRVLEDAELIERGRKVKVDETTRQAWQKATGRFK
jgi:hypothetical protein